MRFAKLGEKALRRRKELKHENERNYQYETFFLYILILFHTWDETGICTKKITKIIEIWRLDYDNTMRRYKFLRQKNWIEVLPDGKIRPLVGTEAVESTVNANESTVEFTVEDEPTVDSTVENCKLYSEKGGKTVNSTVQTVEFTVNSDVYKEFKEPLREEFSEPTTTEQKSVVVGNGNHKSNFSFEDCVRYVRLCEQNGQEIKNPTGLATYLYESGEKDLFIQAALYPEPIEQTIVYDDGETPIGDDDPRPLDEYELLDARDLLKAMAENGANISEFKNNYTAEDWQWLMNQVK